MLPLVLAALFPCQATATDEQAVVRWAGEIARAHHGRDELRWAIHALDDAEAAVPGTAEVAFQRAVVLARAGQRTEALGALEEARRRGWVDAAVARWDEGLATLRGDAGFDAIVTAMDADARALDEVAAQGGAPSDTSAQWALMSDEIRPTAIARFDDGRCIVGFSDGALVVLDERTGRTHPEWPYEFARHPAAIGAVAVDPRGELVAASGADGRVALWSRAVLDDRGETGFPGSFVRPGRVIRPGQELWDTAVRAAWSCDGSHLMTFAPYWLHGPPEAPVQLFDREGALVFSGIDAWFAALSPTEPLIAAVHTDEVQLAWPGVRDQRISLPGAQDAVAFSPDGKRIAVGGRDHSLWILESSTGAILVASQLDPVALFHPVITRLHWSLDGRWLGGNVGKGCHVVGIDPETGKLAWTSGLLGARMYEVFDAHWTADSGLMLFGFGQAACVSPSAWNGPHVPPSPLPFGELVGVAPVSETAAGGASVIATRTCVARVRHDDRTIDWSRVEGRHGPRLIRARSGHVDGYPWSETVSMIGPDGFTVRRVPLVDVFSPKRAAASLAGVAVRPAPLPR